MLQRRTTMTIAGVGIAGAIAITAVVASTSHDSGYGKAARSAVTSSGVSTTTASVNGKAETILTDDQGLPLYYYAPDTATKSNVNGGLAGLWPPVTSTSAPTALGLPGALTTLADQHGSQLAYNGHLLYTFVSDSRGVVTGEGMEHFFVVTPKLNAIDGSSSSSTDSATSTYGGY